MTDVNDEERVNMQTTIVGLGVGGATGLAMVLADVITGASAIGLREAVGFGVCAFGIGIWIDRRFNGLENSQKTILDRLQKLPCEKCPKP